METNATLSEIILFFQIIIPIGAAARLACCYFSMSMDSENAVSMKPRIRNAIIFTILAEGITSFIAMIASYYS